MADYKILADYMIYDDVILKLTRRASLKAKCASRDQASQVDASSTSGCCLNEIHQQSVLLVDLSHTASNRQLLLIDKSVQFNYLVSFTDTMSQLRINQQRLYTVTKQLSEQTLSWEEHGITIIIPNEALPPSVTSCDIAVVPIVEGSFVFPYGTTPVSAIYAIGVSCELAKPITISIQHCVELTAPSHCELMCFAKAEFVGHSPPYEFKKTPNGVFTVGSQYGKLETSNFTFFTVLREGFPLVTMNYKLLTFLEHSPNMPKVWTVHFVVTKNISSHIQNVTDEMKALGLVKMEEELLFNFSNSEITIRIEKQSINGWHILPAQASCKILQEDVDSYISRVPKIAMNVIHVAQENAEAVFCHDIAITGTTKEHSSVSIAIHVQSDEIATKQEQPVTSVNDAIHQVQINHDQLSIGDVPKLSAVLQPVDSDWYQLGQSLGVEESLLIEMKQKENATDEKMKHVLKIWLEEFRTLTQLEKALKDVKRDDVIPGLHDTESSSATNVPIIDEHPPQASVADKCDLFADDAGPTQQVQSTSQTQQVQLSSQTQQEQPSSQTQVLTSSQTQQVQLSSQTQQGQSTSQTQQMLTSCQTQQGQSSSQTQQEQSSSSKPVQFPNQKQSSQLAKDVFRKNFAGLSKLMSTTTNRLSIAAELYSKELITEASYDQAIDSSSRTDMEKGTALMGAIKETINSQPESLRTLIGVLERVEAFQSIAKLMNEDLVNC